MKRHVYIISSSNAGLTLTLIALFVAILVPGCSTRSAADKFVLATVDGSAIEVTEFKREYSGYLLDTGLPDSPRRRRAFLERLIGMKLLVVEARESGLSDTDAFRLNSRRVEEKLLLDLYIQRTFFDTLAVTETEMQQMLVRVNTLVKARHLYARSRRDADILHARLQHGETFAGLAKEVFQDPVLRDNGGLLGFFEFDEMDPDFEDAAFSLQPG